MKLVDDNAERKAQTGKHRQEITDRQRTDQTGCTRELYHMQCQAFLNLLTMEELTTDNELFWILFGFLIEKVIFKKNIGIPYVFHGFLRLGGAKIQSDSSFFDTFSCLFLHFGFSLDFC